MKRSMKLVSARTSCWWGTSAPARRTWPRRCACWRASGGWRPASSPRHRSSCGCGAPATRGALTVRPRSSAALGCSSSTSSASCRWIPTARALLGVRRRLRAAVGGHHHEPGVQPVGRGVRRRPDGGGRAHRQGHGHVGLAPAGLAEEHEVLAGADEAQRKHVVAAPALGEPHVRPVEPLGRLVHGEPRLPEQPCPLGRVPVRELGLEHGPAARHLRPLSCPRRSFPPAFARCRYDAPTTLRHAVWSAWPCSKPKNYRAQF